LLKISEKLVITLVIARPCTRHNQPRCAKKNTLKNKVLTFRCVANRTPKTKSLLQKKYIMERTYFSSS